MQHRLASTLFLSLVITSRAVAAPTRACLANSSCGLIPGESDLYNDYPHTEAPWPGTTTGAVLNTTSGKAGVDDLLFQNLLAAEWSVFSFYQQGVERFNASAFNDAGFPENTYERIREIRNNEAGHLRIFQNQISSNSIKPGPCKYQYPFRTPEEYLALQTYIEVSSMAFLTGLELQAKSNLSKAALVAIASTETRHNVWSLMANWNANPFAGPADTIYPYANQILQLTKQWIVNGSCPRENPPYPYPSQELLPLDIDYANTASIAPGAKLKFKSDAVWAGSDYHAVFMHGVVNITEPFNTTSLTTVIPKELEKRGIYAMVIATEKGAPTAESVVAGPLILLELPERVNALL